MITYDKFTRQMDLSIDELCRQYFKNQNGNIRIKKEHVAVKNLIVIINATLCLSMEKGFHKMSLRDLSRASGLSMGAMYAYIESKDDLVSMIHDIGKQAILMIMEPLIEDQNTPWEKLCKAILSHIYLSEWMYPWFYFFFMETKHLRKEDRKKPIESEQLTERIFHRILDEGKQSGDFEIANTLLMASLIKALMQDWYLKRWKYKERQVSVESYSEFVITLIKNSILKKEER